MSERPRVVISAETVRRNRTPEEWDRFQDVWDLQRSHDEAVPLVDDSDAEYPLVLVRCPPCRYPVVAVKRIDGRSRGARCAVLIVEPDQRSPREVGRADRSAMLLSPVPHPTRRAPLTGADEVMGRCQKGHRPVVVTAAELLVKADEVWQAMRRVEQQGLPTGRYTGSIDGHPV